MQVTFSQQSYSTLNETLALYLINNRALLVCREYSSALLCAIKRVAFSAKNTRSHCLFKSRLIYWKSNVKGGLLGEKRTLISLKYMWTSGANEARASSLNCISRFL